MVDQNEVELHKVRFKNGRNCIHMVKSQSVSKIQDYQNQQFINGGLEWSVRQYCLMLFFSAFADY